MGPSFQRCRVWRWGQGGEGGSRAQEVLEVRAAFRWYLAQPDSAYENRIHTVSSSYLEPQRRVQLYHFRVRHQWNRKGSLSSFFFRITTRTENRILRMQLSPFPPKKSLFQGRALHFCRSKSFSTWSFPSPKKVMVRKHVHMYMVRTKKHMEKCSRLPPLTRSVGV